MDEAFSDRLRSLRKALGMTQADLAARLSVSQGVVSRWEKGRHNPNERLLHRLAELGGMAPAELRYGAGGGTAESDQRVATASPGRRRRLTDLLQDCIVRARHSGKGDVAVALEVVLDKCWADDRRSEKARRSGELRTENRPAAPPA